LTKKIRNYAWTIPFIIGYILWAVFYRVNPLHYDMYVMKTDFLVRNSTFIGVLKAVFFTGGCWKNARYLVNIINIYFVSNEWLFDYVMPLVFVLGVYYAQKTMNKAGKWYVTIAGLGLFMCVSNGIVGACYSYSYVLYLLPVFFVSMFVYLIEKYMEDENTIRTLPQRLGFILLVYCCACFNEHLSCAFSVTMIWYLIKEKVILKRKGKLLPIATAISLAQTIYMNMYLIIKQTRPLAQNGTQLVEIIKTNFRILILETWISNPVIVVLFLATLLLVMRDRVVWRIIDSTLLISYLLWFAAVYINGGFDTINKRTSDVEVPFVPENLWWLWALLYISINLMVLYQLFITSQAMATIFFLGGCSTVPILVTPNTGWSISAIYIFMIIITTVMLMQGSDCNKCLKAVEMIICIFVGVIGLSLLLPRIYRINTVNRAREKAVKEVNDKQISGDWDMDRDTLYLPAFDTRDVVNGGRPDANSNYMWNYCYAYNLDKRTIIESKSILE